MPVTSPGPNEVLIDVKAAGLCHTDVGIMEGVLSHTLAKRPQTIGHEIAGVVSGVGDSVDAFSLGDKVVVSAQIDGPGGGYDGGYADKVVAPAKYVVPLRDGVSWEQAAAATDAGATSYHATVTVAGAAPGVKVGIIGFGGHRACRITGKHHRGLQCRPGPHRRGKGRITNRPDHLRPDPRRSRKTATR